MYDFYIESSELCVPYRPRRCIIRHMASTDNRLDLAVVDVYPPLGREVYSTESEIKALIVVPKFAGENISSKFNRNCGCGFVVRIIQTKRDFCQQTYEL